MQVVRCVEGVPFQLDRRLHEALRTSFERLSRRLRPRFTPLSEESGSFTVHGIIGTVSLSYGTTLEIVPKTTPESDWIHAVLQLLVGADRIDLAGVRAAGLSAPNARFIEVVAAIYASRLDRAIRRDGPILMLQQQEARTGYLSGKLHVSRWVRASLWQPTPFPVFKNRLTADHEVSRGLAWVAEQLAGATPSTRTRSVLRNAAKALRPGLPDVATVNSSTALHVLPPQWKAYQPAWSLARAILMQRALLRPVGSQIGASLAIEAWPLLERVLERGLRAAVELSADSRVSYRAPYKTPFLRSPAGSARRCRDVEPDGALIVDGDVLAIFEAKYRHRTIDWPRREDLYQAYTAAAVSSAPVAVLVYPGQFEDAEWEVVGLRGGSRLIAKGVGLYDYRGGESDRALGLELLRTVGLSTPATTAFQTTI